MARNVEIKAHLRDIRFAHATAARLSASEPQRIEQRDVFFHCASGRLKLRFLGGESGELIHYERRDAATSRISDYVIAPIDRATALGETLRRALHVRGTVEKTRWLYMIGQTRVHIDEVRGLGAFLEFEVVLRAEQSEPEGAAIAENLMREFGIEPPDVIACAYIDLLEGSQAATGT
jgi:predicted adenylyl cyclase CyaB